MFLAGDEFCNTQFGNNNPYCQDNEISWLDWGLLKKNQDIYQFFRYMIHFRKKHPAIHGLCQPATCGLMDVSLHGVRPFEGDFGEDAKVIAAMFAGFDSKRKKDDIVYILINAYWEAMTVTLPTLPGDMKWSIAANTGEEGVGYHEEPVPLMQDEVLAGERSVMVLVGGHYD